MRLKLTRHFQDRMAQRGINIEHVKQAISKPDSKKFTYEGKIEAIKKIGDKTIGVIYCKEAFKDKREEYLIVTAYYI